MTGTSGVAVAVKLLGRGELIAFPTETVYGLGADARRDDAVGRIFAAKGRPRGNPIIVHVADTDAARQCVPEGSWTTRAQELARRFWPGPLTLILPRGSIISPLVSAGRQTVALRSPDHPAAQALLRSFGGPIAAPSANRSGFTSPTTAWHVLAELGGRVNLVLDGGPCRVGVESTVLDISEGAARILRPGAVTAEMLEAVIGPVETVAATVSVAESAESPGQHDRHYSPRTPAYWFARQDWPSAAMPRVPDAKPPAGSDGAAAGRVVLITYDPQVRLAAPHEVILLPADAADYAREIYASLRAADDRGASTILVLLPDTQEGLWAAVMDRLKRAARPLAAMR